jgi:hypothetical protein
VAYFVIPKKKTFLFYKIDLDDSSKEKTYGSSAENYIYFKRINMRTKDNKIRIAVAEMFSAAPSLRTLQIN